MAEPQEWHGPRGRGRRLIAPLQWTVAACFVLAVSAVIVPDRLGRVTAPAVVTALIAAPLGRVAFLAVRWMQLGDRRYAGVAAALIIVLVGGFALAFLH